MAMIVKNNLSATRTLNVLNKNSSALKKSLEKVSSGQKINSAQDDASGYAISERMREQIRSLEQDSQNVQNGSTLFKIVLGGVDNIVEELRNLKELAINSANDTNTDSDRATIQKEFQQKIANINDIATTTNYNGKILLDGRYTQIRTLRRITTSQTSTTETTSTTQTTQSQSTSQDTVTDNSQITTITEIQGSNAVVTTITKLEPTVISSGNFTISEDGYYLLAENYTGTITIDAQNVKLTQENSETALTGVTIIGSSEGNVNLWIENLNLTSPSSGSAIKFQGSGNYLTVEGTNTVTASGNNRAISCGDGVTITGDGILNAKAQMGAGIGGVNGSTKGDIVIGGNVTINAEADSGGAGIGSSRYGIMKGSIIIGGNATVTAKAKEDAAAIGCGQGADLYGDIIICNNATVTAISTDDGAGIGTGSGRMSNETSIMKDNGYIIITGNATVTASSKRGAGIGAGYSNYPVNGANSKLQGITIADTANVTATSEQSVAIGGKENGAVQVVSENATNVEDFTLNIVEQKNVGVTVETVVTPIFVESEIQAMKIQHGAKANQAINFFINDLHTKSLGTSDLLDSDGNFLLESDAERFSALGTDTQKQIEWLETVKAAENKTLDDISVTTKYNANIAVRVLDGAIEYALGEATNVGAYLQRLEYTNANITTMGENVQAAESTIRDADMAKTFTAYTTNNVLLQAAQSMLAQANQNSSSVLSLLQ